MFSIEVCETTTDSNHPIVTAIIYTCLVELGATMSVVLRPELFIVLQCGYNYWIDKFEIELL